MWTRAQAKLFYDANPGLQDQWAAQAGGPNALNYGNFAYQAYMQSRGGQQGQRLNTPVELTGSMPTGTELRDTAMDNYNQANRLSEEKLKQFDWYNDPLWKLRQSYGDNLQKGQVFTGPWEAGPAGRKDVYDLLMEKYGTVNLNDLINQAGRPNMKGATNLGKSQRTLSAVRGWNPTQPGMLSGGSTSPATLPAGTPTLPGGSAPATGASGAPSGSFGGASPVTGAGMLNNSQNTNTWAPPVTPTGMMYPTVGDSSAWQARPTNFTPQQLASGMFR